MKILVTGGNGRIGRFVVAELQTQKHDVIAFDMVGPGDANVDFVKGDITKPDEIDRAMKGVDGVIHLAAIPSMMPGVPYVEYMNVNVTGTFNVLAAAANNTVMRPLLIELDVRGGISRRH